MISKEQVQWACSGLSHKRRHSFGNNECKSYFYYVYKVRGEKERLWRYVWPHTHFEKYIDTAQSIFKTHIQYVLVLIFYWCVTSYHKLSSLKQHTLIPRRFHGSVVQSLLNWVLRSASHKAVVKVSAATSVSSEAQSPLPCSRGRIRFFAAGEFMVTYVFFWGQQKNL